MFDYSFRNCNRAFPVDKISTFFGPPADAHSWGSASRLLSHILKNSEALTDVASHMGIRMRLAATEEQRFSGCSVLGQPRSVRGESQDFQVCDRPEERRELINKASKIEPRRSTSDWGGRREGERIFPPGERVAFETLKTSAREMWASLPNLSAKLNEKAGNNIELLRGGVAVRRKFESKMKARCLENCDGNQIFLRNQHTMRTTEKRTSLCSH